MAITITITEKAPATGLVASLAAGGSLVVGTTYYYKLVAVEYSSGGLQNYQASIFAPWSQEVSVTPTAGFQSANLTWTASPKVLAGYNGYLVLRTTTPGDYSSATEKLIGPASGSTQATTSADATSFVDTGTRTRYKCAEYTLGIPRVAIDTTSSSVATEADIYQGFITAGKAQFVSINTNHRAGAFQYHFTGMFYIGYSGTCSLRIQNGRNVIFDGSFNMNLVSGVTFLAGSAAARGGASIGFVSFCNDTACAIAGPSIYNSKIYEAGVQLGITGGGYYGSGAFSGVHSVVPSIVQDSSIHTTSGIAQISGPVVANRVVLEIGMGRLEARNGKAPALMNARIETSRLYSYSTPYVRTQGVTLTSYGVADDLVFNGASTTWLREFDLIDFTPTNEPPRATSLASPSGGRFHRKWSLNATVTDAFSAPVQGASISVLDVNSSPSTFTHSGTTTSATSIGQASTSFPVLDGTKFAANYEIKIGVEVMLVTNVTGNLLTVVRGYAGSFANEYGGLNSVVSMDIYIRKNSTTTNALGVVEEQYLTQCTYQGNAAQALPYQYTTVTYTPHVITISKYGYQRVTLTQTVAAPIKIAQRMLADAHITATEATAGAYTGIAIDQPLGTITITEAHTLDELYDYVQWWASRDANLKHAIPLTTADGITYTLDYDLVIDGCTLTGTGNIAMSGNTLTLLSSGSSTVGITHAAGALTTISVTGYTVGARLQVYDTVDAVEIYNGIPAGTTLTLVRGWSADHLLRIRMARVVGVDADLPMQTFAVFSQAGAQVLLTPAPDTVYEANGIDGDTVTEFTADFPNVQIDIADLDGATTPQRGYAWYMAGQMTAPGIANFHGGMSADDSLNYRINASVLDMRVQNASALPCVIAGARIYRDDGSSIFATGLGPIQAEPSKAYVAAGSSAASVALAVRSELAVELARVDVSVSSRLADADYTAPGTDTLTLQQFIALK